MFLVGLNRSRKGRDNMKKVLRFLWKCQNIIKLVLIVVALIVGILMTIANQRNLNEMDSHAREANKQLKKMSKTRKKLSLLQKPKLIVKRWHLPSMATKCVPKKSSGPEICSDGYDNNGDCRVDCDDPLCRNHMACPQE